MSSGGTTGRFERSDRLLDSRDFRRVMRRGRRRACRHVVVMTTRRYKNTNDSRCLGNVLRIGSRLGITASRKVGNAVVRNRFKRRTREWFRQRRGDFPSDIDLVIIARRSGSKLSLKELDEQLCKLLDLESIDQDKG
ncbi:MAG: ribonuclease P protein component [bacterium]|nr:ribonuclease P protein component [Deltaproteobacteria bacterium]MCP4904052.1 ribonuclease P protein component [bacterium]